MNEHVFKVELQQDYSCKIELGGYERLATLDRLKEYVETQEKMGKWMDDASVPKEQKEEFQPMYQNLLQTISFIWDVLKRAGATKEEIEEHLGIPF